MLIHYLHITLIFTIICNLSMHAADQINCYAIGFAENIGKKEFMEDRIIVIPAKPHHLFGILDGHSGNDDGGQNVINTIDQQLQHYKATHPLAKPSSEEIKNLFDQIQRNLAETDSGSTASLIFCDEHQAWCAQLGDSMIIDSNGSIVVPLHTPHNENEFKRVGEQNITKNVVDVWRLKNRVAMTRGFGHQDLAEFNFISDPEIKALPFAENDFFIVTSDGVYEEFCQTQNDEILAAKYLATYVKQRINDGVNLTRIAQEILLLSATGRSSRDTNCKTLRKISDQESFDSKYKEVELALKRVYDNQSIIIVQKKSQSHGDTIKTTSTN